MSTKKQRSEAASILSAQRKTEVITCVVCGTKVKKLVGAKYCNNACRQKAKYARQKAAAQ